MLEHGKLITKWASRPRPMENSENSIDQVPDPSTWIPLKFRTNQQSSSAWTSVYQAEINQHQHPELVEKLSSIPIISSPITRLLSGSQDLSQFIVVKQVSPHLHRPPHDTLTEIKILTSLHHPNIVPVLAHREPPNYPNYCLFLPLYPATLYNLLNDQTNYLSPSKYADFDILTRRITRDIGSAIDFLHSQSIAHRDINPSNVALTDQAHAVLIDFGTAWPGTPSPESNTLEFELGTMPYRAPELLFGSRSYSPFAIDVWSFGALIAELFLPMVPLDSEEESIQESATPPSSNNNTVSNSGTAVDWYCNSTPWSTSDLTPMTIKNPLIPLVRKTLFEGSFGDIGLVGSIFKILGTPNSTTWPEAKRLPDFSKLNFHEFEKQNLEDLLPHLTHKLTSLERNLEDKVQQGSNGVAEERGEIENLTKEIKVERTRIDESIKLIESFLNYSSSLRLDSFKNIFGSDQKSSLVAPHREYSWLFTSVQDEDRICFNSLKLFLGN